MTETADYRRTGNEAGRDVLPENIIYHRFIVVFACHNISDSQAYVPRTARLTCVTDCEAIDCPVPHAAPGDFQEKCIPGVNHTDKHFGDDNHLI